MLMHNDGILPQSQPTPSQLRSLFIYRNIYNLLTDTSVTLSSIILLLYDMSRSAWRMATVGKRGMHKTAFYSPAETVYTVLEPVYGKVYVY